MTGEIKKFLGIRFRCPKSAFWRDNMSLWFI
ncbi:hypothetical protein XACM_4233 [Xanthomonas euvesicatoria pv. citrumelo F1]|nr:hypothetical protein XACM_4233 [Xanthomonas euvesicatoria pv. citrumelo F1]